MTSETLKSSFLWCSHLTDDPSFVVSLDRDILVNRVPASKLLLSVGSPFLKRLLKDCEDETTIIITETDSQTVIDFRCLITTGTSDVQNELRGEQLRQLMLTLGCDFFTDYGEGTDIFAPKPFDLPPEMPPPTPQVQSNSTLPVKIKVEKPDYNDHSHWLLDNSNYIGQTLNFNYNLAATKSDTIHDPTNGFLSPADDGFYGATTIGGAEGGGDDMMEFGDDGGGHLFDDDIENDPNAGKKKKRRKRKIKPKKPKVKKELDSEGNPIPVKGEAASKEGQEEGEENKDDDKSKVLSKAGAKVAGPMKRWKCEECDITFLREFSYLCHMKIHIGDAALECEICHKVTKSLRDWQRHKYSSHVSVICDICGKVVSKRNLNTHKKIRHLYPDLKLFKCDKCGRDFKTKGHLKTHEATHEESKDYVCPICGNKFRQAVYLDGHMKTVHTEKKPYKCKACGKEFFKRDFQLHVLSHSDLRPYQCKHCTECFKHKENLRRHLKKSHPDQKIDVSYKITPEHRVLIAQYEIKLF